MFIKISLLFLMKTHNKVGIQCTHIHDPKPSICLMSWQGWGNKQKHSHQSQSEDKNDLCPTVASESKQHGQEEERNKGHTIENKKKCDL